MEITRTTQGEIVIYDLDGKFDTNTSPEVGEAINLDLYGGKYKMIIDLSKTSYISSAGLRVILSANRKISYNDGDFRLCCPSGLVKNILEMSGFDTFLKIRESLEETLTELLD